MISVLRKYNVSRNLLEPVVKRAWVFKLRTSSLYLIHIKCVYFWKPLVRAVINR